VCWFSRVREAMHARREDFLGMTYELGLMVSAHCRDRERGSLWFLGHCTLS
jgi:hypothetical protein